MFENVLMAVDNELPIKEKSLLWEQKLLSVKNL